MRECSRCGGHVQRLFRYCPWCASPQRLKLVEFFRPHALIAGDRAKALRVSRYLGPRKEQRHVRFSVWSETEERAEAEAAVSLDEHEAERLAYFLRHPERNPAASRGLRSIFRDLPTYFAQAPRD